MREKQSYAGLDRFRIFAAFLVVAIHTSPFMSYSKTADFFFTRVLGRIAVPFFFMVTGQFVLAEYMDPQKRSAGRITGYLKKIALLYVIAILIYMPPGIYAGHYQNTGLTDWLRMVLFDGTFYHLWYFPACILGVSVVCGMGRFLKMPQMFVAAGALYLAGLCGDSYYGLVREVPAAASLYEMLFSVFSYTRNGIFLAPLFLLLGALAGRRTKRMENIRLLRVLLVLSFLAMTEEAFVLRHFKLQRHDSMYAALPVVMYFLYEALLLSDRRKPERRRGGRGKSAFLRTAATWIYILHPLMIIAVRGVAKKAGLEALFVENSLLHYLAVLAGSCIVSFMIALLLQGRKDEPFEKGRAWIELDQDALSHNVAALRAMLPETCRLMPAVKADAYGHGAKLVAEQLCRLGVDAFCVACVQEGVALRRQGISGEILILGYTHPKQFGLLRRYRLTQTVVDHHYAMLLNRYGRNIHVHIGVDTGMHRLGERSENVEQIASVCRMKHLVVDGMFTHLCVSDTDRRQEQEYTRSQAKAFYQLSDQLREMGLLPPGIHMQASYGILNYPDLAGDYARVGIALYGVLSTQEDTHKWQDTLRPVLSLKARVATVRTLYHGESAGYGLQFTAKQDTQIATIAIGYADGLPRALSGGVGSVLIRGQRAPIIGRICMDQTLVDVSGIDRVRAGDTAVLIGRSGEQELSVCEMAEAAGTITNEILSRMGARLERVVV